jgi:adenylylsulfate kinase
MRGLVVWFTGLPSSGKTTLARETLRILRTVGESCCLLDGDEVRECLHPPPGYGPESRTDFYKTLASLAAMLSSQGLAVLVAATAHRRADREVARGLATERFIEVFVDTPLEVCEARDAKGLYKRARAGEIQHFPGVHEEYEPSGDEALRVSSGEMVSEAERLANEIRSRRSG